MSNRSLARKNRFKYKTIRKSYKIFKPWFALSLGGLGKLNANGRVYNTDLIYPSGCSGPMSEGCQRATNKILSQIALGEIEHPQAFSVSSKSVTELDVAFTASESGANLDVFAKHLLGDLKGIVDGPIEFPEFATQFEYPTRPLPWSDPVELSPEVIEAMLSTPTIEEQWKTLRELSAKLNEIPEILVWEVPKNTAVDQHNYCEFLIDRNRLIPTDKEYIAIKKTLGENLAMLHTLKSVGIVFAINKGVRYIVAKVVPFSEERPHKPFFRDPESFTFEVLHEGTIPWTPDIVNEMANQPREVVVLPRHTWYEAAPNMQACREAFKDVNFPQTWDEAKLDSMNKPTTDEQ